LNLGDIFIENKKRKNKLKDFKRQKLEEVFILMDLVLQENIKPIIHRSLPQDTGARIGMIIRFYFPSLNQEYNEYIELFKKINTEALQNLEQIVSQDIMMEYTKKHKLFVDKIVVESKKYIG